MKCKTCGKNIDNIYYLTKKQYCSRKCEDLDVEKSDFPFKTLFNYKK